MRTKRLWIIYYNAEIDEHKKDNNRRDLLREDRRNIEKNTFVTITKLIINVTVGSWMRMWNSRNFPPTHHKKNSPASVYIICVQETYPNYRVISHIVVLQASERFEEQVYHFDAHIT